MESTTDRDPGDEQPEPECAKIWTSQDVAARILYWNLFAILRRPLTA